MTQPTNKRPRGTGSILVRKRSPFLWIQYHRDGKPYRESAGTSDRKKAQRMLQQRLNEVASGNFLTPQDRKVRVSELAEGFLRDYKINERKSLDDAQTRWDLHVKPVFGHLRANAVTSDQINKYVDQRQQEGAAVATINRELAALKRMFKLGQKTTPPKVLRMPNFPSLQEHNVRKGFVEHQAYKKLAAAAGKVGLWLRAMFETAYTYGWRDAELKNLRVRQVDLLNRTIRLDPSDTKNREGRIVVITETLHSLIASCVAGKLTDDYVFTRDNGKPVRDFRESWANICADVGVPDLLFHDLRRTAVRNMVRDGIPEKVAMTISGHKTRSTFERYNIVDEADLREAAMKTEAARLQREREFSATDSDTAQKPSSDVTASKTLRVQ